MGNTPSASKPPSCQPGCSPTSPISQAIAQVQAQPQPTQDPVAQCTAKKIKENDLRNQLNSTSNEIDSCDPSVKSTREFWSLQRVNQDFVQRLKTQSDPIHAMLQEEFSIGNELAESVRMLKQYETKLKDEEHQALRNITKMEHSERAYRRDFLDSEPTSGVPFHIFGLQTSDDKVMLTFWIISLVMFSLLAHVVLTILTPNATLKTRAMTGSAGVISALIVCYLLITYFG